MISTVTRVTSSVSLSDEGRAVVLTVRVAPEAPHETTPTGTVTFAVGGSDEPLTASLDDGTATVTVGDLGSGPHEITATYHGDTAFAGSTGVHTFTRIPTGMTITSTPNPSAPGQLVTITATVTPDTPGPGVPTGSVVSVAVVAPGTGTPTGTVTFVISGTGGGTFTAALNASGVATFTTSTLGAGTHNITGTYNSDGNYATSSGTDTQTVNAAATTTTVTSAPNPSTVGQTVTITATVSPVPPATGIPTGTVTFTILGPGGGTFVVPVNASGQAIMTISTLDNSNHNITATYSGDSRFGASSGTTNQVVKA